MKAFMSMKFHEGDVTKKLIDDITEALKKVNIENYMLVRDVEKYGEVEVDKKDFMQKYAFPAISNSELMIIEFSEKGVGLGIGAGYAYASQVPIYIIAKTGSDISSTMNSLSQEVIFYDNPGELTQKFNELIQSGKLKTKKVD